MKQLRIITITFALSIFMFSGIIAEEGCYLSDECLDNYPMYLEEWNDNFDEETCANTCKRNGNHCCHKPKNGEPNP